MKCEKPFIQLGKAFPCGRCLACRIARRRTWTHRLMLEAAQHSDKSFLTLTYAPENLVFTLNSRRPTLWRGHLSDFLKRLRGYVSPARIRFYACGEYGEDNGRPHYHMILFGYPQCDRGQTRKSSGYCCPKCELIRRAWPHGNIDLAGFSRESSQYVAGYVMKKLGAGDIRLDGRIPEFSNCSLKPGIGAGMMDEVASVLLQYGYDQDLDDVPDTLRLGDQQYPLGRYLKNCLRERIGRAKGQSQAAATRQEKEMLPLQMAARAHPRGIAGVIEEVFEGARLRLKSIEQIKGQRRNRI